MSDATDDRQGPAIGQTVEEVQGIFATSAALETAVAALTRSGFDHADFSLPQASPTAAAATPEQGAGAVTTETDLRQARTLGTSMAGSVGALAAAGLVVASGGALLGVVAAAAAAGVGAGGLANAAGQAAGTVQQDALDQQAAAGTLVLSVRIASPDRRARAERAMAEAGATRVSAITRSTASVDAAGWTG